MNTINYVRQAASQDAEALQDGASDAFYVIRGVRLDLDKLVNRAFFEPVKIEELRLQFQNAKPFPHIVLENLFDPKLLELVHAEFDLQRNEDWRLVKSRNETVHRSQPRLKLGPATELYFSTINSGWFMNFLEAVTGVENLIPDPQFFGGGMHETRNGGWFQIHVDFNLHHQTMLDNEMVFITYLNKNWRPEYAGALELWDADIGACAVEILPEFGRTALFRHGLKSQHGHPEALKVPEDMTRRSVAAYYYTNRKAKHTGAKRHTSLFFPNGSVNRWTMLNEFVRYISPPIVLKVTAYAKETVKHMLPESVRSFVRRLRE